MDPSPYGSGAPKEFVTKRLKLAWRILLISNLGLGAYMFAKARKKDLATVEHKGVKNSTVLAEPEETRLVVDELSMPSEYTDAAEAPIYPLHGNHFPKMSRESYSSEYQQRKGR
ncbi:PREDICTED: uncharacterized protein LOC104814616 [Tarenaya hassleriana]|uniref:uncharacterized protein LOC104814616 n=1 Tax=Tarenaya hassleriana TaxID=28532 RepID=UPI00053C6946|nr:PREDICTED: uncharacterized protein LOC104814616 [Tarenaya hassleriana]